MGYWRNIWRPSAAIALTVTAAVSAAEPPEPLTVTSLGDSENKLLVTTASTDIASPEGNVAAFTQAISEAVRTQQESTEARCEATNRAAGSIARRWAWEARCRYRRY